MSTKINMPLLIFALMIQILFCSLLAIMPAEISSAFPLFADPIATLAGLASPSVNFGMSSIIWTENHEYSCATGYLECIAFVFEIIWSFIMAIINTIIMAVNVAIYIATFLANIAILLFSSGFYVISAFPSWIGIPIALFLLAMNVIIIIDIALVAKGLIENLI